MHIILLLLCNTVPDYFSIFSLFFAKSLVNQYTYTINRVKIRSSTLYIVYTFSIHVLWLMLLQSSQSHWQSLNFFLYTAINSYIVVEVQAGH